jgi:hypothetical protein
MGGLPNTVTDGHAAGSNGDLSSSSDGVSVCRTTAVTAHAAAAAEPAAAPAELVDVSGGSSSSAERHRSCRAACCVLVERQHMDACAEIP